MPHPQNCRSNDDFIQNGSEYITASGGELEWGKAERRRAQVGVQNVMQNVKLIITGVGEFV